MPFLGKTPAQGFVNSVTKDDFTPNGTTTAFTLSKSPATVNELEVYVGNVRQEPTDAYSVSGTTLTMTEAPATGTNFYVMHIGGTTQSSTTLPGGSTVPGDFNVSGDSTVLGQIAIGTTTINRDIHISTARPDIRLTDTTDNSYSEIVYNANSLSVQVDPEQTAASSAFIVKTDGTTRIRVDSNGLLFGTGTAAANYLDDYEEGTWTPNLRDSSGNSVGQSSQTGHYTKIGNLVYCIFAIQVNSVAGAGNALQIQALPFTVENVSIGSAEPSYGALTFANNLTSKDLGGGIILRVNNASDYIECKYTPGGSQTTVGATNWNTNDISASTFMCGSFTYRT